MIKRLINLSVVGIFALGFFVSPSFAVDSFSIQDVEVGDNSVRIEYDAARNSDRYTIRKNNHTLESDRIDSSGNGSLRLPMKVSNREIFSDGDTIEITITSNNGRDIVRNYTVRRKGLSNNSTFIYNGRNNSNNNQSSGGINGFNVPITAPNNVDRPNNLGGNVPNAPVDPTLASTINVDKAFLVTESGKQLVNLTFNKGFVAKNGDFILAIAVDKDGKRLKTEEFSLPTTANTSVKLDLEPPINTVSYQFIFVAGEASNKGNARTSIVVKDGKDQVLALAKTKAYVNTLNEIDFSLKDKSGKATPLTFVPSEVSLVSTNNEGHTILLSDVMIDTKALTTTGQGKMQFKTTELGTLNLRLSAKDDKGNTYLSHLSPLIVKEDDRVIMTIGSNTIKVGQKSKIVDASPEVKAKRTFVPLRALVESFDGATLKYTPKDKKITITKDQTTVVLTIGSKTYLVNGQTQMMDVSPYVTSTLRTMVPVRAIAEALGYEVSFKTSTSGANVIFEQVEKK